MIDFRIFRASSEELFPNGELNPRLIIEEGCWYLCTDTAELFVGVTSEAGLALKRINETEINQLPEDVVLRSELEGAKQEIIETVAPEVEAVKTKVEEVILPKIETVDTVVTTVQELKDWVDNKEFLQHIDLEGYATKDWVEDRGYLTEHQDLRDYATKQDVFKALAGKANEILFTTTMFVRNPSGNFTTNEDVSGLTLAELFAKLLGLSDEPGSAPDEPDYPENPQTPEEILEYLTKKNTSIYVYDETNTLVQESFTEPVAWTPSEASVRMDGVSTKYTIKDGDTVVEAGYQQATTYSDTYWLTVALPSEINSIKVKMYDPDVPGWVEPLWHMVPAAEQTIEGYTIWAVPEEFEIDAGATYRFVIVD